MIKNLTSKGSLKSRFFELYNGSNSVVSDSKLNPQTLRKTEGISLENGK